MIPLALALLAGATPETLERIADSQEQSLEARSRYVYRQEVKARLIRANGQPAREEHYLFEVTPTATGTEKKLVEFRGTWFDKGKAVAYDTPGFERKEMDIDADLIKDLVEDLTSDNKSRDGIDSDLFPLIRSQQEKYNFQQESNTLRFRPKGKDGAWHGEIRLDPTGSHPVFVSSNLAKRVPAWAKVVFGTNFHQVGFSVSYLKLAEDAWFPETFGTEFRLRVLFGYARTVTISLKNSDFRKTSADSTVRYQLTENK